MEQRDREKVENQLVVKDNELITRASYNLTMEEQKLLCYVISKIKPTDKEFERYTISAMDFAELCGIDKRHIYRDFKKMVESFEQKAQWIKIDDNNIYFRVFSEAEYNESKGSITVVINSRLKKYLLNLQSNYTKYELWNILSLKSKYSIRLYELFRSYSYQKEKEFDVEQIKSLLCAEHYTLYANFKQRVLDKAIAEINEYTDLIVSYKTKQEGKSHRVKSLTFYIKRKQHLELLEAYYKTVDKINKRERQIPGQMSIFDKDMELHIAEQSDQKDYSKPLKLYRDY